MSNELTFYERQKLQLWLRTKQSIRKIAKIISKDHSVIIREIKRNSGGRAKYRADIAQRLCDRRKHQKHFGKLDKNPQLKEFVENRLIENWSPEQIAGRLKTVSIKSLTTISHESIYYYIYEKSEKYKRLYIHLRTNRSKRKKQGKRKSHKLAIPGRISIHERPDIISQKERYGDWESDTVEFMRKKNNPYLSVQYERKSGLVRLHKMAHKTAEETKDALIGTAESVPAYLFKTITFDNGKENAKHMELRDYYPNIVTYFCDSFSSWQKGGVENMNKLIRQYLPKKTDMRELKEADLLAIQEQLNDRPRKSLNYLTPNEVINKVVH